MINKINHDLARKYIITELAIRTLERDRQYVDNFKSKVVMEKFFEQVIRKAKDELLTLKNEMGKIGLKLQKEERIDEYITVYSFIQRGYVQDLRYANNSLRNNTIRELERLFKL